jgi:hypothetical protein
MAVKLVKWRGHRAHLRADRVLNINNIGVGNSANEQSGTRIERKPRNNDEPTMDGIGEVQCDLSTARSGNLFAFCRRRPVCFCGACGNTNLAWGNYARFVDCTAKLNWFLPAAMIPALAIIATAAETLFGLSLLSVEKLASVLCEAEFFRPPLH